MKRITKDQFATNAIWKMIEQIAAKGFSFLVSIVLARVLAAEDYGIIAITMIFINLSAMLVDGGFGTALIQKENVDEDDFNCVFIINITVAILLYVILFLCAPYVATFYEEEQLVSVLRVIGLTFFAQALISNRIAWINRTLQFKLLFFCNAVASVVSGIAGIALAYLGIGVWALVFQQLLQQVILALLLFKKVKCRLKVSFQKERFTELFHFGIGVLGATLVNYLAGNLYSSIIGKKYSVENLGYYDRGGQLPMQVSLYTFGAVSSVLLPTLASYQNDLSSFKSIIRRINRLTAYIMFPLMMGMLVSSQEIITVIWTDKWMPVLNIMRWNCVYYLATPFMLINVQAFFALGHGFLRLKTEVWRLVLLVISVVVFGLLLNCNIYQLSAVNSIVAVAHMLLTLFELSKLIAYKRSEFIEDIIKPMCATLVMVAVIIFVERVVLLQTSFVMLCVKVCVGGAVYWGISAMTKMESYEEIKQMLFKLMRHFAGTERKML